MSDVWESEVKRREKESACSIAIMVDKLSFSYFPPGRSFFVPFVYPISALKVG